MGLMYGLDTASVDSNPKPNWTLARKYADWIYLRRSFCYWNGTRYIASEDTYYKRDAQPARDAGFVVGAYLFPGYWQGAPSPEDQVKVFVDAAGDIVKGKDFIPAFDLEFPGGVKKTGRSISEIGDLTERFIVALESAYGSPPVVYTSNGQIADPDTGLDNVSMPFLARCPLWVKTSYVVPADQPLYTGTVSWPHIGPLGSDPHDYYRVPRPWDKSGFWLQQFQGDCIRFPSTNLQPSAFARTVDVNRFHYLSSSSGVDPRIVDVQKRIAILGGSRQGPLNATGVWDSDTDAAVKNYQTAHGLQPDGVIGPKTFAALSWEKVA